MTPNTSRIVELLHRSRSSNWIADDTMELAEAVQAANEDESKLALLAFSMSLLFTARQTVLLQRDAAILQATLDERDAAGPAH